MSWRRANGTAMSWRRANSTVPWDLPAFAADPPGFLHRRAIAGGPVAPLRLGRRSAYVVAGPAEVHQILSHHRDFPKGMAHDPASAEPGPPLALALGNGLLSSSGTHHARQRRLMQPAFSHASVASYADRMAEEAERLTTTWADGGRLDLNHALSEVTLHILTRTVFDTPLPPADVRAIRSAVTAGQRLAGVRGLIRSRNRAGVERLMPRVQAAMAPAREVIGRLVAERTGPGELTRRDDMLSLLLEAVDAETGERMTPQDVEDEVLTLLLAGHETTTNALSWAFALLAANPRAERRLQAEVDAAYADGRTPSALELTELPWTTACLDEAMRLYPPAWLVLRHTDRPARIGTYDVPAGSTLVVSPFATHRIPALWPQPAEFRPERFAPGGPAHPIRRRPLAAYLPFGGGARICIGEHFSLLEARIVLAVVARDWAVRTDGRRFPAYKARITLGPKGGLPVTVHRRSVSA
jgi:cytochrome P450